MLQKNYARTISTLLIISTFLAACASPWKQHLPEGGIIYQSGFPPGKSSNELGFISEDGTDPLIVAAKYSFQKPVFSPDGKLIFGLMKGIGLGFGYPGYWDIENGKFKICMHKLPFFGNIESAGDSENPYLVIVQNVSEIDLMDLSNCKIQQKVVDVLDKGAIVKLGGGSLNPSEDELVYTRIIKPYQQEVEFQIIKLNLATRLETRLSSGVNPIWSRDGTQIAYIGMDGLYIMNSEGGDNRKLVNKPLFDPLAAGSPELLAPIPRWSPDGEWLLLHECLDEHCSISNSSLIKVHVVDGQEEQIHIGGMYPSWRPTE